MPYKSPQINWNLLVGPASQGISDSMRITESKRNRRERQFNSLAQSIDLRRDRAESSRRFDAQQGLQQERMDMTRQRFEMDYAAEQRKLEDQRRWGEVLGDLVGDTSEKATQEIAATGALSPPTSKALNQVVSLTGSPEAALRLVQDQATRPKATGSPDTASIGLKPEDCPGGT